MSRSSLASLAALAVALVVASAANAQDVASLLARPASVTVRVGEGVPLSVVALDATGNVIEARLRVVGPRRGVRIRDGDSYEIIATYSGDVGDPVTLSVPVSVRWPRVTRIEIATQPDGSLYEGTRVRHVANALHADGTRRPGASFYWATSNNSVASIDQFGNVTAVTTGAVTVTASFEGVESSVRHYIAPFPASGIEITGGENEVRTGDVQTFTAVAHDDQGVPIGDVPIAWTHSFVPAEGMIGTSAPGQLKGGKFVADVPGVYTVMATTGSLTAAKSFSVVPRDVVRPLEVVGMGRQSTMRTTDFWVFEGQDGRDYAITGSKVSGGHAYVFDVTDPSNIIKTDSIQVDARAVNDVKVSPDARYATITREGASNRRNGVVILDLADPAHPTIASSFDERLTGGVHNAYPTEDYLFALSGGDKYVIIDVRDLRNPQFVSEYNHPDSRVHDVWVHDGIAYSAEWGTGVVVVDVGNGRWGGSIENPVFVTSYPVPSGGTHAVFPYHQEETGKFYLFLGDEIMSRRGLANSGTGAPRGDYAQRYDPQTGMGGSPLTTQGYIQVVDFTDPEHPDMVARYEVTEYGTHNIWVEDDVLYQAYYEGGLRVVDVSGELMGNLYTQGREIAVFKPFDRAGYVANSPMVWSAMPFKGNVFFTDTNSGIWAVKVQPKDRPVSE